MENKNAKNADSESFAMYLVKEYARQSKRLFILLIISIIVNIVTVGAFLLYNSQYDYTDYEIQQDGQGTNNYIGGDGDNINGSTDSQTDTDEKER